MVPSDLSIKLVELELAGAASWLARREAKANFDHSSLVVDVHLRHPVTGKAFWLIGDMAGYKAVPPAWTFADPSTRAPSRSSWPRGVAFPDGKASIFMVHRDTMTICAPFNRLAYAEANGPHGDWGSATCWLQASGADHTVATTLGDMLAVIELHLAQTTELAA